MRRTLATIGIALALGLTACGDDTAKTSSDGAPQASASVGADLGGDVSKICVEMAKAQTAGAAMNQSTTPDPATLKQSLEQAQAGFEAVVKIAPDEIKADLKIMADAFSPVIAEMQRVNYDTTKADFTKFQGLGDPKFQAASTKVSAYYASKCGVK